MVAVLKRSICGLSSMIERLWDMKSVNLFRHSGLFPESSGFKHLLDAGTSPA
jgi:hypothetical protein